MKKQYRVGRLPYRVIFAEGGLNDDSIIPSSAPFEEPLSDGHMLFELTVDDTFRSKEWGEEVGQFDCGGNNHGVYMRKDGSYEIHITDFRGRQACLLEASADFSRGTVALNGGRDMRTFGLNNALMMMYAFAAADQGTLLMHASVVREKGLGYLFLGVSGTGKSTHTANWLRFIPGTDLMNDDNPVVRFVDGQGIVFGSPWSGKTPCYRNIEAPIGAFVQLKQAPYNKIRRQTVIEAFASLLPSCSVMKWDKRIYGGICTTVTHIMEHVPTYYLENLPDEAAVRLSYETITAQPSVAQ